MQELKKDFLRFRNSVIAALVIIALGCSWGIFQVNDLSKARHNDSCWSSHNNGIVLRALINESVSSTPKKQRKQAKKFVKQAFRIIELKKCGGANPTPPSKRVLALAKTKG